MIIRAKYLALPLVILCNSAFAVDVNCNYSDKTQVESVGTIDGVRNYNSKATDYAEEKRICAVTFDAKVGEKWYKTKGFPAGKLGKQMGLVYELQLNGLEEMVREIRRKF